MQRETSSTPRITLPERDFKGYIFDLDGTLVESMPLHYRAWREALRRHGAPVEVFGWQEFLDHGGMAARDIVQELNEQYGLKMEPDSTADEKRNLYACYLEEDGLNVIPETVQLVRNLRERGIPYAIGTGSAIPGARATLCAARIEELFSIIVTPEDVVHGKPAPDIFLLAAQRMGVPPQECVVFEDAEPGLQAARAAGMECVRVGTPMPSFLNDEGF